MWLHSSWTVTQFRSVHSPPGGLQQVREWSRNMSHLCWFVKFWTISVDFETITSGNTTKPKRIVVNKNWTKQNTKAWNCYQKKWTSRITSNLRWSILQNAQRCNESQVNKRCHTSGKRFPNLELKENLKTIYLRIAFKIYYSFPLVVFYFYFVACSVFIYLLWILAFLLLLYGRWEYETTTPLNHSTGNRTKAGLSISD